jgi:group I intron endonuclease
MNNSGVYKITCVINNKIYIGSSKNISKRWKVHVNQLDSNNHINEFLQNSWNKYGECNFVFEILENCEEDSLLSREQYWMDYTKCYDRNIGFNACIKADRPLGYKHTIESKLKMSLIKKEQLRLNIIKCNLIHKPKGYKHSEETKVKIRNSKLGSKNPMYGKKLSEEDRKTKGANLNSVPRWNKGLTKKDDPRIEKLATWKNKLPPNAILHTLIDLELELTWTGNSLKELSKVCPLSLATLNRLKTGNVGKKIKNKYKIIW